MFVHGAAVPKCGQRIGIDKLFQSLVILNNFFRGIGVFLIKSTRYCSKRAEHHKNAQGKYGNLNFKRRLCVQRKKMITICKCQGQSTTEAYIKKPEFDGKTNGIKYKKNC